MCSFNQNDISVSERCKFTKRVEHDGPSYGSIKRLPQDWFIRRNGYLCLHPKPSDRSMRTKGGKSGECGLRSQNSQLQTSRCKLSPAWLRANFLKSQLMITPPLHGQQPPLNRLCNSIPIKASVFRYLFMSDPRDLPQRVFYEALSNDYQMKVTVR